MGPSTKYHTLIIFALGGIRNYQSKPRSGKKGEIFFSNLNIFHLYKEEYYPQRVSTGGWGPFFFSFGRG